MRVLVTGATGFIGRRCVAALTRRGADVHGVTCGTGSQPVRGREAAAFGGGRVENPSHITWHSADLHDPAQRERLIADVAPTHLLHLAWYVEPKLFWHSPENFRWVESTAGLMHAFARTGARAVLAGTSDEYDPAGGILSEGRTPAKPSSIYGACKHATHMMASAIARQSGVTLAWARLFAAYGPGEPSSKLVSKCAADLLQRREVHIPAATLTRDYVYVDDVAALLVALLESDVEGAMNAGSGTPATIAEIAHGVADVAGGHELIVDDQPGDEPPVIVADMTRARTLLGWTPQVSLADGIRRTVDAVREPERVLSH
jgi:nucleoside-diphosphate-sugar epimerase